MIRYCYVLLETAGVRRYRSRYITSIYVTGVVDIYTAKIALPSSVRKCVRVVLPINSEMCTSEAGTIRTVGTYLRRGFRLRVPQAQISLNDINQKSSHPLSTG